MSKFSLTDHPVLQLHTVAVTDPSPLPGPNPQAHRLGARAGCGE